MSASVEKAKNEPLALAEKKRNQSCFEYVEYGACFELPIKYGRSVERMYIRWVFVFGLVAILFFVANCGLQVGAKNHAQHQVSPVSLLMTVPASTTDYRTRMKKESRLEASLSAPS